MSKCAHSGNTFQRQNRKVLSIRNISCFLALKYFHFLLYEDGKFKQEFLETHNKYREKHNAPPLTFSNELNSSAQRWADELLSLGRLQHSKTSDGENVFTMYGSAGITLTGLFYTKHASCRRSQVFIVDKSNKRSIYGETRPILSSVYKV